MTARIPTFTPSQDYHLYAVTVGRDRYDEGAGKTTVVVNAIGPANAENLALEELRDEPQPHVLAVALVCDDCRHPMRDHGPGGCRRAWYGEHVVQSCGCGVAG